MNPLPLACSIVATLLVVGPACTPGGGGGGEQTQPPVIVVQTPPEGGATAAGENYAGANWQTPQGPTPSPQGDANPDMEPMGVIDVLKGLKTTDDAPKDQAGDKGFDDLTMVAGVVDDTYLYGRIVTREPMQGDDYREIRFWLEQTKGSSEEKASVELKIGTRNNPCELRPESSTNEESIVDNCFWVGHAIDFRIPLDKLPSNIDPKYLNTEKEVFHLSGFETCCMDEARQKPFDTIEKSHPVQRTQGSAQEVETK